jgi:hypothetical protein
MHSQISPSLNAANESNVDVTEKTCCSEVLKILGTNILHDNYLQFTNMQINQKLY